MGRTHLIDPTLAERRRAGAGSTFADLGLDDSPGKALIGGPEFPRNRVGEDVELAGGQGRDDAVSDMRRRLRDRAEAAPFRSRYYLSQVNTHARNAPALVPRNAPRKAPMSAM